MTKDQLKTIEQKHNVIIDPDAGMYTRGSFQDVFGWDLIPQEWIDEVEVTHSCFCDIPLFYSALATKCLRCDGETNN